MATSLTGYRPIFLERVLDLLWRQWSSLGVAGHGTGWRGAPIDPEALLLISCTVARHDARLFDAVLEWLGINGRYVNVQRLRRILSQERFAGERVLAALAATVKDSVSAAKWARSAAAQHGEMVPEPLFHLKDGRPMPVVGDPDPTFARHGYLRDRVEPRGVAGPFRPEPAANLLLRLRALFGVNARCEIMAFLLLNSRGAPRAIARQTYTLPATVARTLRELRDSGYVVSRVEGRRRLHRLVPGTWRELLLPGKPGPSWVVWPRLFSALETTWTFLSDEGLEHRPALAQASALRRVLLESVVEKLDTCNLDLAFGDISGHPGPALTPFFIERMNAMLEALD